MPTISIESAILLLRNCPAIVIDDHPPVIHDAPEPVDPAEETDWFLGADVDTPEGTHAYRFFRSDNAAVMVRGDVMFLQDADPGNPPLEVKLLVPLCLEQRVTPIPPVVPDHETPGSRQPSQEQTLGTEWVFERSSGHPGYRCQGCATWVYENQPRLCHCKPV